MTLPVVPLAAPGPRRVRGRYLDAALARLGVVVPGATLAARARALEAHLRATTPPGRLARCGECGGWSDLALVGCPYCGTHDGAPRGAVGADDARALDAMTRSLRCVKAARGAGAWRLGRLLLRAGARGLWRARRGEDGCPAHASFEAWVRREVGVSPAWAYELMAVAREFSEADVRSVGPSKLGRVLKAPEAARPAMLEAARAGAGRRALERVARDYQSSPATGAPLTLTARLPDGWAAHVPLGSSARPRAAARSLEDGPAGEVALPGGARLRLAVLRAPDGTLRAVVRISRADAQSGQEPPSGTL